MSLSSHQAAHTIYIYHFQPHHWQSTIPPIRKIILIFNIVLSHSYSDGQEILRMMKMITIYSTVVRHYAEFGSANSPLVIFFSLKTWTVTQYYRSDTYQNVPFVLKYTNWHRNCYITRRWKKHWSLEVKPPRSEKQKMSVVFTEHEADVMEVSLCVSASHRSSVASSSHRTLGDKVEISNRGKLF